MAEKAVADVLNEAAALVERGWCQGETAQDADGVEVPPHSDRACAWCMVGSVFAAIRSTNVNRGLVWAPVDRVVGTDKTSRWNDAPERTQAEVVAKLREAAALAAQEA